MIRVSIGNAVFNEGIRFPLSPENPVSISVKGHALFDTKGKDIVCAAVSVLTQTMVLSLSRLEDVPQDVRQEGGELTTRISVTALSEPQRRGMKTILDVFLIGVLETARNYPGRVEIEFLEN